MLIYKYSQIPNNRRISYKKSLELCKKKRKLHLGQLKLFFSELIFLSLYAKPNYLVIYVGASPGYHITKLADMFPDTQFDLWDPRKSEVEKRPNIRVYTEFFSDDIARKYVDTNEKILFICDIRTMSIAQHKKNKDIEKMDDLVDEDMNMQKKWCQIIIPEYAYLKFRLPYEIPKTKYLSGDIYLQPYTKISTEARLLTNNYNTQIIYDNQEFEEKMAYHNAYNRCNSKHYNKWKTIMKKYNLYNCWDNAYALHIIHFYLKKIKNIQSEKEVGILFMDIIDYHKKRYHDKYDIIFN